MEGQFQSSFGKIEGVIGKANSVLGAFGIGLGVGAVAQFGREVLTLADNLQNLHDQTGISVQLLSGIKSPLEEAGSSLDAFARGVFNLQKNLGNVDKDTDPAAQAIKRLGLNLDELRNINTDEFIKKITDSLANIQNPIERNTILFNLLGKSAKELGPAFQQLVGRFDELKNKGLNPDSVRLIDDVGDSLTRLKNQALALGAEGVAGLLRFFGVFTEQGKLIDSLIRIQDEIDEIDKRMQRRRDLRAKGLGFFTPKDDEEQLRKRGALEQQLLEIDKRRNALNAPAGATAPFKGLETKPTAATKGLSDAEKAQQQTGNFLEGLERQLSDIAVRSAEIRLGPEAGLTAKLDAQLEEFKRKLTDDKLPIPKGLDAFFADLKTRIVEAATEFEKLKLEMERVAAVGKMMSQDSAEWLNVDADLVAAQEKAKGLREEFAKIRSQLAIESVDTSTPQGKQQQRALRIEAEALETTKKIEEMGKAAGMSQEEIAEAVNLAWSNAFKEINSKVEETTVFQQRAFERMHDAVGDITRDLIRGQIDSWEEFGTRVLDVIASVTAEFVAMQAKIALFGEEFGSKTGGGGQVGGIVGAILQMFGGGTTAASTPIGGSFNVEELMWGGMATVAHRGGIVGDSAMPRRSVPASLFHDAPRYHGGGWAGLKPGEMPIIAQRGERILPKWESGFTGSGSQSGGGGNTKVIINNLPGARAETETRQGPNGEEVLINLVDDRVSQNVRRGGNIWQAISQTGGVGRAPVNRG